MPNPDSGDLLLVAAGDEEAFRRILQRWRYRVYALFERSREPSAATEASVDVFARLWHGAGKYEPAQPFAERLFGLIWKRIKDEPAGLAPSIPAARLGDSAAARTALLREAAASLPPEQRAAFLFTHVAELPLATAAAVMGLSEAETRSRLAEAAQSLERTLAPLLEVSARSTGYAGGGAR